MVLDKTTVEKITFGTQRIECEDGGFRFHRMPESQAESFAKLNEAFRMKTTATSGILFDFFTDSEYFSFSYTVWWASTRRWYSFDVDINGIPVHSIGGRDITEQTTQGKVYVTLPEGRNRVTVWFPNLFGARLSDIELSDGASIEPVKKNGRLIVYGDSITQGYDSLESRNSYVNRVAKELNIEVINLGIGASKCDPSETAPAKGDAVMIAYGTNDWFKMEQTREEFVANIAGFMDKIAEYFPGKPTLVLLPIWRKDCDRVTPAGTFEEGRNTVRREAEKHGFLVADGFDYVPHDETMFMDGRLHPNDEGFAHYASAVIPHVEKLMR